MICWEYVRVKPRNRIIKGTRFGCRHFSSKLIDAFKEGYLTAENEPIYEFAG